MADICPFCLSPNAENLDTLVVYADRAPNFPSALVPLVQAAILPLQQSHQDAVERGVRDASLALPPVLGSRLKLYRCPSCRLRFRTAQLPLDVLYRTEFLRVNSLRRSR